MGLGPAVNLLYFFHFASKDGNNHGGTGALVPSLAGFCRAFSHVEPTEDPPVCPLSAGSVPVQAASEGRGPDPPAAGLGAVPTHEEQRVGADSPGESGARCISINVISKKQSALTVTLIFHFYFPSAVVHFAASILFVCIIMRLNNKVCDLSITASLISHIYTVVIMDLLRPLPWMTIG